MIQLITGGVRSGKSAYALSLTEHWKNPAFLATAEAFDEEMQLRIKNHQAERQGRFQTFEVPVFIDTVNAKELIFDCLTLWVNNLYYYEKLDQWKEILHAFLARDYTDLIIVTNEVGLGIMPENKLSRQYIDTLGAVNRFAAERADSVTFMVAGQALRVK